MRVLCLFLLCVFPLHAVALCERALVVNVGNWQPYMYLLPDGDAGGIDVDVVKRVAARLKCRLTFSSVPPERAHPLLEKGGIDILMAASDRPERHRYAWFTHAYRQETMAVLTRQATGPASLADVLHGDSVLLAPRFGWYGKSYARWQRPLQDGGKLQYFDDYAQGTAMLQAGRGDLILGDEEALQESAAARGIVLRRLFVTNASPVHLMLSRRTFTAADVARFDDALSPAMPAGQPAANPSR